MGAIKIIVEPELINDEVNKYLLEYSKSHKIIFEKPKLRFNLKTLLIKLETYISNWFRTKRIFSRFPILNTKNKIENVDIVLNLSSEIINIRGNIYNLYSDNTVFKILKRSPYLSIKIPNYKTSSNTFSVPRSFSLSVNEKRKTHLVLVLFFERIINNLEKFEHNKKPRSFFDINHVFIILYPLVLVFSFLYFKYFKNSEHFQVYFRNLKNNKKVLLKSPTGTYLADPFIFSAFKKNFIFHEEYDIKKRKGYISVSEISNDKQIYKGTVLEEDFHLSYPFVFKYDKKIYMIPESNKSNSILLYSCIEFPMKWKFEKKLIENIDAADSLLIEKNGLLWLFVNRKIGDYHGSLYAYYSKDLYSDWKAHKLNPIEIFNDSRNGGLIEKDGKIIFPKQNYNFCSYGDYLTFRELNEISKDKISFINVKELKKLFKTHHFSSNDLFDVYDKKIKYV